MAQWWPQWRDFMFKARRSQGAEDDWNGWKKRKKAHGIEVEIGERELKKLLEI